MSTPIDDPNGFLNNDTVRVGVEVANWQDAVSAVGDVMVAAGLVERRYIAAMKSTIQDLGPYSVIAPGIAMPHARPEDGVLKPGFALITLAMPVEFGNAENDPVDIVIAFGATDKEKHIHALAAIAKLLGDVEVVEKIRNAKTTQQLLKAINPN
jgi:PTS system ascorbate-specific IIA component